jgi:glycosyltransferase involved in cell wall biosynthesis
MGQSINLIDKFGDEETPLPLVSVLIPLYNHESYIVQCLESILADGYPCTEIIIVDDGSVDASLKIVIEWHTANSYRLHERFEISSRENRGLTRTLNDLVRKAEGQFLVILASDDYLLPGGIRARLDYLSANSRKMAVIGDCIVVNQDGMKLHDSGLEGHHRGRKSFLVHDKLIDYEIVFHWCVPGPVFMAKRELYPIVGDYDETISVEDRDFYLRLAARNILGFVDYPVAAYRIHIGSFTQDSRRHLSYNQAILVSVTNNYKSFKGLRKIYLYALRLRLIGLIARMERRYCFRGHFYRTVGHYISMLAKLCYDLLAPIILALATAGRGKTMPHSRRLF